MDAVIEDTRQILKEYRLCDHCLGRMFASKLRLVSHRGLGERIRKKTGQARPKSCYICKSLMSDLGEYIDRIVTMSKEYEFSTFLIGAILQPSILDRDDAVRSKFRLRGIAGIKSDVTREMGRQFGKKTRSKVDYQNPDLVFTVDFKKDQLDVKPKSVILQGRYTKEERGMPQKQASCERCDGKGCFACDFHGMADFGSVEGRIARFLFEKFGAQQAKMTWIGSEDDSSLVLGNGRPFFVRVTNPHKRYVKFPKKVKLDGVSVLNLRPVAKVPTEPVRFRAEVLIEAEAENEIPTGALGILEGLGDMQISVSENPRNQKKIHDIAIKKSGARSFAVLVDLDGGIPIKRLVSGPNVEPNISMLLDMQCKCITFDFHKIMLE